MGVPTLNRHIVPLLALCVALTPIAATASTPAAAFGVWATQDGNGHVEIAPCGASACGAIVWGDRSSGPSTDVKNPDAALRTRPLIGLRILEGYSAGAAGWINGRVYDPKSGNTYRSELLPQTDGTLRVKGCMGPICRTETWRRVR